MKKIFCIIILFISVCVSAFAQTNVEDIRSGFQVGSFYINVDEGSWLKFGADIFAEDTQTDDDCNIVRAVFESHTDVDMEEKGERWFIEQMKSENGQKAMFKMFYEKLGIVLMEDFTVTDKGRAKITMMIRKEYEGSKI